MSTQEHNDLVLEPEGVKNLIFNPDGKKMVPFFHVMISYRVNTELDLAGKMFDRLLLNSFDRIPEAGKSQWPDVFTRPDAHQPGHANIFLDKRCLKSGDNWDLSDTGGGFVGALLKSLIFVPLLSWKVEFENKDDPKSKKKFKGSIGEMVARYWGEGLETFIDTSVVERPFRDAEDNVLLELILAMELHVHMTKTHKDTSRMHPCLRLLPIAVDKIEDFYKHVKNHLPNDISTKTYDKASKFLKHFDISISESERKSVRDVVSYFFELQMEKFTDFGEENFAVETVCNRVVAAVLEVVSKIDPLSLFDSKPLCRELDSFLSQRNCSYMTRILASNNITSLRQLSFLTHQNAIYDLAKQCSAVSSKSAVAELITLTSVIEDSKRDELSGLLSTRLDRFIDKEASFETVIKSSSGLIISCAQKSWRTLYFLLGMALLIIGIMSVVSTGPGGNTIFNFVGAAFLFGVCIAAVFHSPKRAYVVYCCLFPAFAIAVIIGFCIDFIKNGSFSLENATRCSSAGNQLPISFRTCAIAQILCGPFLTFLLVLLNLYQALHRQDLAWATYLLTVALYISISIAFEIGVLGYSVSTQGTNFIILFGVACIFLFTEWMYRRARWKVLEEISKDERMYQHRWATLLDNLHESGQLGKVNSLTTKIREALDEKRDEEFLRLNPTLGKVLKSTKSMEVLQDCNDIDVLYARAEFINDAFQSLVSVLLETGFSAKPAAATGVSAEGTVAEAGKGAPKADPETGVGNSSSSSISPLKKNLEPFFAEKDIEEVLKHLTPHYDDILTLLKPHFEEIEKHLKPNDCDNITSQHTKEGNGSTAATAKSDEQPNMEQHFPGATFVDIENKAHQTQDRNVTHPQTKEIDGSGKPIEQSSGTRPDNKNNQEVSKKSNASVRAVSVRRGPVKLPSRAISKSYRVYNSQVERLTDIVRSSVDCSSFAVVNAVVQMLYNVGFVRSPKKNNHVGSIDASNGTGLKQGNGSNLHLPEGKILEILRVRNRFDMEKSDPHWSGGFRDLAFKVKVGFKESSTGAPQFVPVNRWSDPSVKTFVCELQIHHQLLLPSNVLDFWLKSFPEDKKTAAAQDSKSLADEFHHRYVESRDKLAS